MALYEEGRFSEALSACHAVSNSAPSATLETKAQNLSARIRLEAGRQRIKLE